MLTPSRPAIRTDRRTLLGAGAFAALAALTSCTTSTAAGPGSSLAPSTSPSADPAAKIVTLDPFSTYNLLDLGIVPAGAQDGLSEVINPRYADVYAGLPKVGDYAQPDFEAIATIAPDLILASSGQQAAESRLSRIARTVLVTATTSSTWRKAAQEVATAVGREDALAELRSGYEARAADIRDRHAPVLAKLTWAMVWQGKPEGFSVRSTKSNGGQVLALAGVRFNAVTQRADGDDDTELSWENVNQIADADVICLPGSTTGRPNSGTELIKAQRVFGTLPAVEAGHVIVLDYMTPGSYLNATQLLDELDAYLATLA